MIEFEAWPKIARLNRDIVITEKIDGTNGAIVIEEAPNRNWDEVRSRNEKIVAVDGTFYGVAAQSRKRLITPEADNFGFAKWVHENAETLAKILGPGRHYGEWWGSGIQRGYGFKEGQKYFSLFNVKRWDDVYDPETWPAQLSIVPVLYQGPFHWAAITMATAQLRSQGSAAHGGFMQPEGIVIYHTAANQMFKVTLENDEAPKGLAA